MATSGRNGLEAFHPILAEWFTDRYAEPTPVQSAAWERIGSGKHCLISAPTGTGKTLAAFLIGIDRLIRGEPGRLLYISPLKALNNDIERNLSRPLAELRERFEAADEPFPSIHIGVRSGDTEQSERRRLITHPPEILVTTPESLNLMLSSKSGVQGLRGFTTVILDEIHAVLSSKRGTYLMSGVERLVPLCGEFQRIGLSATVRPMSRVSEILGAFSLESGEPRPVESVEVIGEKRYELRVSHPELRQRGEELQGSEARDEWWRAITRKIRQEIDGHRSTLIFANSRRMVEKLARMLNEEEGAPVYAHHGSLSKEIRRVVEERLKAGELKALVATSSLELGIDVGDIDHVILVQSPFSVASGIQRIGRAGHGVGATSRGTFLPIHSRDLVESATLARAVREGAVEEINPPEKPLDLLAQLLLSMVVVEPKPLEELYNLITKMYAYRELSWEELELVVEMLAGKYADSRIRELSPRVSYDKTNGLVEARKNAAMLLYMSGGVIPDRGYYTLRLADSNVKIGELDEEFVWERSLGDAFPLGNRAWRITGITNNDVLVVPAEGSNTVIPFWRAEEQNRPYPFSAKIGELLEEVDKLIAEGGDPRTFLQGQCEMEEPAAEALLAYLERQRKHTGASLPHRHHLLVERYRDPQNSADATQVVLHTLWGGSVNKPFALTVAAAWQQAYGYPLEVYANNDAVLFNLPHDHRGDEFFTLLEGQDLGRLLRDSIEGGGLFGAKFRETAQRALLLPRRNFKERMPLWLNRLRAKKLLKATADRNDFPVTLETWRECMQSEFDLSQLELLLDEIATGETRYSVVDTVAPSPFSDSIIWRQTNQRMYEDDSASSEFKTSLSEELLEEILRSPHLRPEIPREMAEAFQKKLQRLLPGYAPESAAELRAWVEERRFIPDTEWRELRKQIDPEVVSDCATTLHFYEIDGKRVGVVTEEYFPAFERIVNESAGSAEDSDLEEIEEEPPILRFLSAWLDYYAPLPYSELVKLLPIGPETMATALEELTESGAILFDRFTEGSREEEVCTRENVERLLRLRRATSRPTVDPLSPGEYQLFLAAHQGVVHRGGALEALETRLELLFGYRAAARLWEEEILPARLEPYYPSWLDRAMAQSDLLWFGCGKKMVSFAFAADLDLFLEPGEDPAGSEALARAVRERRRGDFLDLAREAEMRTDEATEALWELVWQGSVTNDAMEALRRGVGTNFTPERQRPIDSEGGGRRARRGGYSRWRSTRPMSGSWVALEVPEPPADPVEEAELLKDRARLLLNRYGILYRELLSREAPLLQWGRLFRTLRLMELSGEITTGHFVHGLTGLQFASPEAIRELRRPTAEGAVYWLNAADPASLCGLGIDERLPRRVSTNHTVYQGARPVLISKRRGKELHFLVSPEEVEPSTHFVLFRDLLSREQEALKRIRVEEVNGVAPADSPYSEKLREFGFFSEGPYMTLYRRY